MRRCLQNLLGLSQRLQLDTRVLCACGRKRKHPPAEEQDLHSLNLGRITEKGELIETHTEKPAVSWRWPCRGFGSDILVRKLI